MKLNKFFCYATALCMALALGFTSCGGDDDNDGPDNPGSDDKSLVSSNVPSEGWTGNSNDGVLKYAPSEYDAEDINAYFTFSMKGGVCEKAVINVVFEDASQAKQIAKMLTDGTWAEYDDDDDDDYSYSQSPAVSRAFTMTSSIIKRTSRASAQNSDVRLPIPVQQEGKVVYVVIPNLKGLSASDLKAVVEIWSGNASSAPDRVIFGKYSNGVYTCKNMHGLNIDYVIETKYNSNGFCSKYTTTITLPTENWAKFFYTAYEDQMDDFEQQFGQRPDLSIKGKTVTIDAFIIGNVTEEQVDSLIYTMDWINNCPFFFQIFS